MLMTHGESSHETRTLVQLPATRLLPITHHSRSNAERRGERGGGEGRGGTDLHVEEVELDRIASVHVLVGEEKLATQQKELALVHSLLTQRLRVVQPVH